MAKMWIAPINLSHVVQIQYIVNQCFVNFTHVALLFSPSFHSEKSNQSSNLSIGFVLYQNDRFFRSTAFRAQLNTRRRVISANLKGAVKPKYVEMLFRPTVRALHIILHKALSLPEKVGVYF